MVDVGYRPRVWVLRKLAAVGCWVMSGPSRAPNRLLGFWVVLVNGLNTVCGVLPPETPSEGRATTACWGESAT